MFACIDEGCARWQIVHVREKAVHTLRRPCENISFPQAGHDQLTHRIAFELSGEICSRSDQYRENIDAAGCAGRTEQSKSR